MSFIISLLSIGPMSILMNDHIAMLNLGVKGPRSVSKVRSSILLSWNEEFYMSGPVSSHCFFFFPIVSFASYFVFSCTAVLPHSPGVVYYHLLLRRETRIPGVAPFSFQIGIWDLFVHRGQKSYTPTAFGKLWTTPGVRCMQHTSS